MFSPDLREGIDYYLENGLVVFTERYLRQRGYCCMGGCRHCPYGYKPPEPPRPLLPLAPPPRKPPPA